MRSYETVMDKPLGKNSQHTIQRFLVCIGPIVLLGASCSTLFGCGKMTNTGTGASITLERQIAFPAIDLQHATIANRLGGGVIVAGLQSGRAFAAATDSTGNLLWQYPDSPRGNADENRAYAKSVFLGVVQIDSGNTLLCGSRTDSSHRTTSLLTILDGNGHVLEQRTDLPENKALYANASFIKCFRWGDGLAVIGLTDDGQRGLTWVMKLDRDGKKIWDRVITPAILPMEQVIELADHSLVFSDFDGTTLATLLVKVNEKGEVVNRRSIKSYGSLLLRSVELAHQIHVITYGVGSSGTLLTLNEQLSDSEPSKAIASFEARDSCGYVLPDRSLALFGRTTNAAAALIDMDGRIQATHTFDAKYYSFTVDDAVARSATEFVAVQDSVSVDPHYHGLVISWLTITR
jgi:hypothetical protein